MSSKHQGIERVPVYEAIHIEVSAFGNARYLIEVHPERKVVAVGGQVQAGPVHIYAVEAYVLTFEQEPQGVVEVVERKIGAAQEVVAVCEERGGYVEIEFPSVAYFHFSVASVCDEQSRKEEGTEFAAVSRFYA